jgi:hypothetical protein
VNENELFSSFFVVLAMKLFFDIISKKWQKD